MWKKTFAGRHLRTSMGMVGGGHLQEWETDALWAELIQQGIKNIDVWDTENKLI